MDSDSLDQQRIKRRVTMRHPAQVGDLLQYRFTYGGQVRTDTRSVIEVIDNGARFVVAGFYSVTPMQILNHMPMLRAREDERDELDFCGTGKGAA
jgi:hypothetical protein